MQPVAPKEIRENIARAKGYLRRGELVRALDTMSIALNQVSCTPLVRPMRYEMEIHFGEFLIELSRNQGMQPLLDPQNTGKPRQIPYQKNKEAQLATALEGLGKILTNMANAQEAQAKANAEQRKRELMDIGEHYIRSGELAKGRSFLKKATTEFSSQPGIHFEVGLRLVATGQHADAAEMFEKAMDVDPKMAKAYSAAIDSYIKVLEYAKAETIYLRVLRQFGGHPRTFARMAGLYMLWHKRQKAEEFALRALHLDPQLDEALNIMDRLQRRAP